jgi:hypothetical protein
MSITIDTRDFGGSTLKKHILVYTNDPRRPVIEFNVLGAVEKVVTVTPLIAKLFGSAKNDVAATIRILPEAKYAFKIVETIVEKGDYITIQLDDALSDGNHEYRLTVKNQMTDKGRYFDTIVLKTDSEVLPEIRIKVFGKIS